MDNEQIEGIAGKTVHSAEYYTNESGDPTVRITFTDGTAFTVFELYQSGAIGYSTERGQ